MPLKAIKPYYNNDINDSTEN